MREINMFEESIGVNRDANSEKARLAWVDDIKRKADMILAQVKPRVDRHFNENNLLREWFKNTKHENGETGIEIDFNPDLDNSINILVINGVLYDVYDLNNVLKNNNVVVENVMDVDRYHGEKIKNIVYGSIKDGSSLVELHSLLSFNRGIYVHVPEEVAIDRPIRILRYYTQGERHVSELNIVTIANNSSVKIIEETRDINLYNHIKVIRNHYVKIGAGSTVEVSYIHNVSDKVNTLNTRKILAEENSNIDSTYAWLGGSFNYSDVTNILEGAHSSVNHVEIVFGSNGEKYYLYSRLKHVAKGTEGRILNRGALKDSAKLVYNGLIEIGNNAYKSDAFLESHVILLSRDASAFDVPSLEIKTNDVKATHSASVSPVDEEQVYYLKTRGLSDDEAKRLIVFGALQPAIERISSDKVKLTILSKLNEKWNSSLLYQF